MLASAAAAAQADTTRRPPPPPQAGVPPAVDTAAAQAADTAGPDSLARDTATAYLPVVPVADAPGPLPRGERWVFTTDSLIYSDITTLSDLLSHLPGVYVARGGWYGQAEIPIYGGQGSGGLEVYMDGVPYLPLGRDSVWLDPARIPVGHLERVEVVRLPAVLRVFLQSRRQSSTAPYSLINIGTGDFSNALYHGAFGKRFRSGIGLGLDADYRANDGAANTSTSPFTQANLWLHLDYVPNPRIGVSYQTLASSFSRKASAPQVEGWKQNRQDRIFRFFLAPRADGLGPRVTLSIASTTGAGDTLVPKRTLTQAGMDVAYAWERAQAGATMRFQDPARPWQIEVRGSWLPVRFVTLAVDGRHETYGGSQSGDRAHAAAGFSLPLGFSARGEWQWSRALATPALRTDTVQEATSLGVALRWEHSLATLEVGRVTADPYQPVGFAVGIAPVAALGFVPRSEYVEAQISLRPYPGFTLSGWYYDPVRGGGDFQPPTHSRMSFTFDSRFLRVFRSGAFQLRAEFAAEAWSRSNLGGLDGTGAQLPLGPATFVVTDLQLRLQGVTFFWMIRNFNGMKGGYVNGLGYPKYAQSYGVHWNFTN